MMKLLHHVALCAIVNTVCHALEEIFNNTPLSSNPYLVNSPPLIDSADIVRITHDNQDSPNLYTSSKPLLNVDTSKELKRPRNSPAYFLSSLDDDRYPRRKIDQTNSNHAQFYPLFNEGRHVNTPIYPNQLWPETHSIDYHSMEYWNYSTAIMNDLPTPSVGVTVDKSPSEVSQGLTSGFTDIRTNDHINRNQDLISLNVNRKALHDGNPHLNGELLHSHDAQPFSREVISKANAEVIPLSRPSPLAGANISNSRKVSPGLSEHEASVLNQSDLPHVRISDTALSEISIFPPEIIACKESKIMGTIRKITKQREEDLQRPSGPDIDYRKQRRHERATNLADKYSIINARKQVLLWYFDRKYDLNIRTLLKSLLRPKFKKILPVYLFYVEMIVKFCPGERSPHETMKLACSSFLSYTTFLHNPDSSSLIVSPEFLEYALPKSKILKKIARHLLLWSCLEVWLHGTRQSLFLHIDEKNNPICVRDRFKSFFNSQLITYSEAFIENVIRLCNQHHDLNLIRQGSVSESQALSDKSNFVINKQSNPLESSLNSMAENHSHVSNISEGHQLVFDEKAFVSKSLSGSYGELSEAIWKKVVTTTGTIAFEEGKLHDLACIYELYMWHTLENASTRRISNLTKLSSTEAQDFTFNKISYYYFNRAQCWLRFFGDKYHLQTRKYYADLQHEKIRNIFPLYLFFVEMINEIVPSRDPKSGGMESALESFRQKYSLRRPESVENNNPILKPESSHNVGSLLWSFLQYWLENERSSLFVEVSSIPQRNVVTTQVQRFPKDQRRVVSDEVKRFINDIFVLSCETLTNEVSKLQSPGQ